VDCDVLGMDDRLPGRQRFTLTVDRQACRRTAGVGGRSDGADRPFYGMVQVARLLGLRPDGLRRWIDGYESKGKRYAPVA
jgi:hypothetical protein